jgi:homoserine kinase type II
MLGDRVSGVLDFEFAGPDLRAFDLARSLSLFTISPWNIPNGWESVTAFILGYRQHLELTPAEIEALPELMRLYRIWSLVHREGRRRAGLASEADVLARAMALLRQDEWLGEQHQELIRLLASNG